MTTNSLKLLFRNSIRLAVSLAIVQFHNIAVCDVVVAEFTSTVSFVQNLPAFGISPSIGDTVTGTFSYDTNAADLNADPIRGTYRTGQLSVTIDGTTFAGELGPQFTVFDNGPPGNDLFSVAAGTAAGDTNVLVNGVPMEGQIALGFSEPAGGLTSDALPSHLELLSLQRTQFNVIQPNGNRLILFDNVRTFTAVPEPSSCTLLALIGATAVGYRRWKRWHLHPSP